MTDHRPGSTRLSHSPQEHPSRGVIWRTRSNLVDEHDDDPRVGWRGDPGDLLAALDEPADFVRRLQALRPAWMRDAACRGEDVELFHPGRGQTPAKALEVCGRCEVLMQCRSWALADESLDAGRGVLGGMTWQARAAHRKVARSRNARDASSEGER